MKSEIRNTKYETILKFQSERGQAALVAVILMLAITLSAVFGTAAIALKEAKVAEENKKSRLSFFSAEAGTEDAVYRSKRGKSVASSFVINLNGSVATTTVTTIGSSRKIVSISDYRDSVRASKAILLNSSQVSFRYGIQVGAAGLEMGNNSRVEGNVFSNGNISGGGSSVSTITGNAIAAGSGIIQNIRVNNGASAGGFNDCVIDGVAQYVSSITNCAASSTQTILPVPAESFPITQAQIDEWKSDAAAGGTLIGYTLGNNSSGSLGPKKISGNITLGNNSTLTLTGTVWVTGTIVFGNGDMVKLDPSYGSDSGVLVVDGTVNTGNTVTFQGSGQSGSYLMLISMFGPTDAIDIGNSAAGAIFYAPNGIIDVGNGLSLKEATGYGLEVGNNTTLIYESGLANVNFTSGPAGGWDIASWEEIIP